MIERFLKAKKEKLSSNQLCEEIATHIDEGLKNLTGFRSESSQRRLIVSLDRPGKRSFVVSIYNLNGCHRESFRFEKVEGQDWIVEREVKPSRERPREWAWERISEKRKQKDLPKLLEMVKNSTPRKYV